MKRTSTPRRSFFGQHNHYETGHFIPFLQQTPSRENIIALLVFFFCNSNKRWFCLHYFKMRVSYNSTFSLILQQFVKFHFSAQWNGRRCKSKWRWSQQWNTSKLNYNAEGKNAPSLTSTALLRLPLPVNIRTKVLNQTEGKMKLNK